MSIKFCRTRIAGAILAATPFVAVAQTGGLSGLGQSLSVVGDIVGSITDGLPGIGGGMFDGVLGATVLQEGGSGGIGNVLELGGVGVISDQLDNIGTPLLGLDGNGGLLDIAVLDGDGSAVAGPDGLASLGLISGDDTGNNGLAALGILNGDNTGNGSTLLGLAALSGNDAAADGPLAIGVLNGDNTGTATTLAGIAALSGDNAGTGPIGVGVLNGDGSGNGTLIGLGVLSGTDSGQGGELGISLLNQGEPLAITAGGQDVLSLGTLTDASTSLNSLGNSLNNPIGGAIPVVDSSGIVIGGGLDHSAVSTTRRSPPTS